LGRAFTDDNFIMMLHFGDLEIHGIDVPFIHEFKINKTLTKQSRWVEIFALSLYRI
jgi:hypothetical protein